MESINEEEQRIEDQSAAWADDHPAMKNNQIREKLQVAKTLSE